MSISNAKLGLVHVAKNQLHMSENAYRTLLRNTAGVGSAKELDSRGFEQVMGRFEALGFKSLRCKRNFGHRPGMASPKQLELIVGLWKQYANDPSERSLNHWLERRFHASNIRFMSLDVAGKAIVALKRMTSRSK
ncbi:regulatory protein GemA [Sedimenticola selenatireducens]|uniref:regulatory protein GemA n=1 Tax=Sedimenticola selenatireducens TaxID=191960 RepID=UPI00048BEE55|nr:regulatory protein GemA [Sedimenticola selenatireducens]